MALTSYFYGLLDIFCPRSIKKTEILRIQSNPVYAYVHHLAKTSNLKALCVCDCGERQCTLIFLENILCKNLNNSRFQKIVGID